MIGEDLILKPEYRDLSKKLVTVFNKNFDIRKSQKIVIGIAGESGSGKSITAKGLELALNKAAVGTLTIHQDGYFNLPPLTNHEKRVKSLENVGVQEVNLDLLQTHVDAFKAKEEKIEVPIVDYNNNTLSKILVNLEKVNILIVEGTYVLGLNNLDWRLFLARDYIQTRETRQKRSREKWTSFIEEVLKKEHEIITKYKDQADIVIDQNFELIVRE
jgi:uridine kinase